MADPFVPPPPVTGPWRVLYVALGLGFVGLAVLGALLPVLPTTPFLLLASYFFVRSSARLNTWLLNSRVFGPLLRDWQHHRAVRPRVKVVALVMLVTAVTASAYFGNLRWPLVVMLVALASIGAFVVIRLPVLRDPHPTRTSPVPPAPSDTRAAASADA